MVNATEQRERDGLKTVRCENRRCGQPLPLRNNRPPGLVEKVFCRHCKATTTVVVPAAPHWA